MRNLQPETITIVDLIIKTLENNNSLNDRAILEICGNEPKISEMACGILEDDGWIKTVRVDQMDYPIKINKSDSFSTLLASGNYAARAEFKKEISQRASIVNHITAQNSNVVIGDNATQTLRIKNNSKEKKSLFGIILLIIGAVAGIFTILTYFK